MQVHQQSAVAAAVGDIALGCGSEGGYTSYDLTGHIL